MKPMTFKQNWMRLGLMLGLLVTLTSSAWLTGCATASQSAKSLPPLSQPEFLILAKGGAVQTAEGVYQPATSEVWVSEKKYRQVEQQNLNLKAAVAKLQAQVDLGK